MSIEIHFLPANLAAAANSLLDDLGITEHSKRWDVMRHIEKAHAYGYREGYVRGGSDEHAGVRAAERATEEKYKSEAVNKFVTVKP